MASTLGVDDVRKIASLAKLELTPAEVELFARQLTGILDYVNALERVNTAGVEPTSHPLAIAPAWRADDPWPSLDREAALGGAPDASLRAGLFKVPKVL